jgi:hypothetical protein
VVLGSQRFHLSFWKLSTRPSINALFGIPKGAAKKGTGAHSGMPTSTVILEVQRGSHTYR